MALENSYNNRLTNSTGGASMSGGPTGLGSLSGPILSGLRSAAGWASTANPTAIGQSITNPISRAAGSVYSGGLAGLIGGYNSIKSSLGGSPPPLTVPHVGSGTTSPPPSTHSWAPVTAQATTKQYSTATRQAGPSAPTYKPIKPSGIGSDYARAGNTPVMKVSPNERDRLIRMTIGEAGGEDDLGQAAVVHVALNRASAGTYGGGLSAVLNPGNFNGLAVSRARNASPDSAIYQKAARNVDNALNGIVPDPTKGALNFFSGPSNKISWYKDGLAGELKIGNQTFGTSLADRRADAWLKSGGVSNTQVSDNTLYGNQALLAPNDPRAVGGVGSDAVITNRTYDATHGRSPASDQPWGLAGKNVDTRTGKMVAGTDATLRMGAQGQLAGPFNRIPGAGMIANVGPSRVQPSTAPPTQVAGTKELPSFIRPNSAAGNIVTLLTGREAPKTAAKPEKGGGFLKNTPIGRIIEAGKQVAGWVNPVAPPAPIQGQEVPITQATPVQTASAAPQRAPTRVSKTAPTNSASYLQSHYGQAPGAGNNTPVQVAELTPQQRKRAAKFFVSEDTADLAGLDTATKLAALAEVGKKAA